MTIRRKHADCAHCPLNGTTTKVWGRSEKAQAPAILFLGEAPGAQEEIEGKPFIGPAGNMLGHALAEVGIDRGSVYFTNACACRPPGNDISSIEAQEALTCCRPGLLAELAELEKRGARVLCALGNTARDAIKPDATRGYVYKVGFQPASEGEPAQLPFLHTFHPSYILRGAQKEEPTWSRDLDRVLQIALGKFRFIEPIMEMFPRIDQLESRTAELLSSGAPLGVDIETTGMRPFETNIIVTGIAWSASQAISFPFLSQGGRNYWLQSEEKRAKACLRELLAKNLTVFQHAPFDMQHLGNLGFPVLRLADDVLLEHHAISPELPHSLRYIASIYADMPDWKGVITEDPRRMLALPDAVLREYNLRDAMVLLQVRPKLLEELEENGTMHIYRGWSMPLVPVVVELTRNGIAVSEGRLETWRKHVAKELRLAEKTLRRDFELPAGFNLDSDVHVRWLIYQARPATLEAKQALLLKYDEPGTRRSKDTKAFRELSAYLTAFSVEPLVRTRAALRKTDGGALASDSQALLAIDVAARGELAEIDKRGKTEMNQRRKASLERLRRFLILFGRFNEYSKLSSTYTDFRTGPDGRLHCWFSIHKTATGRLASSGPNLQNIPEAARKIFVPEPGYVFLEADASNIELRVLSFEADDDVLQTTFAAGVNVHDQNTKDFFGLTPLDPLWKDARMATKKWRFARLYGGTLRGIFEKVAAEVPEIPLTFAQFCENDERYNSLHPKEEIWRRRVIEQIHESRTVRTAFGRTRYLLGDIRSAEREGINFPIQGTAGEIVMKATMRVFEAARPLGVRLIASVHDSLLVECPERKVATFARKMKALMEEPVELWSRKVVFPVEMKMSRTSWGEMEEYGTKR